MELSDTSTSIGGTSMLRAPPLFSLLCTTAESRRDPSICCDVESCHGHGHGIVSALYLHVGVKRKTFKVYFTPHSPSTIHDSCHG